MIWGMCSVDQFFLGGGGLDPRGSVIRGLPIAQTSQEQKVRIHVPSSWGMGIINGNKSVSRKKACHFVLEHLTVPIDFFCLDLTRLLLVHHSKALDSLLQSASKSRDSRLGVGHIDLCTASFEILRCLTQWHSRGSSFSHGCMLCQILEQQFPSCDITTPKCIFFGCKMEITSQRLLDQSHTG